jgi:WD40 repeat protein
MSGYRLIHRQQVLPSDVAVWSLVTTPLLAKGLPPGSAGVAASAWRLWAACSDGLIRVYRVDEVSLAQKEASLTASALTLGTAPTHLLVSNDTDDDAATTASLGYAALDLQRNHAGQDEAAGDVLVAGMDLGGVLRIWTMDEFLDDSTATEAEVTPTRVSPTVEITLAKCTGTLVRWAPPRFMNSSVLLVAVAFLDGSVSLVSTGLAVAQHAEATSTSTKLFAAGTILASWGSGLPLACRLCFRPQTAQLAVSRQDGSIELIDTSSTDKARGRVHRLSQLAPAPARALCFTTDGHLLVGGNDLGRLVVWDVSRPATPAVVNHQSQASGKGSAAWLWQVVPLDERRLVTLATDASLAVWQVDSLHHQPLHAFGGGGDDLKLWSVSVRGLPGARLAHPPRLVAGSENGCFQVYSIVEKA